MRIFLSLILAFYLAFVGIIICAIFLYARYEIRYQVKERIKQSVPESECVRFSSKELSAVENQVRWIHSKEFRYNGKMYDVLYTEINYQGELIYVCIYDSEETALYKKLKSVIYSLLSQHPVLKILTVVFSLVFVGSYFIISIYKILFQYLYFQYNQFFKRYFVNEFFHPPC